MIFAAAILAVMPALLRASESDDLWPLAEGYSWKFLDGGAKSVELEVVRTGPKSVFVSGKKHSVTGYIVATKIGGTAVREDTFFKLDSAVYRMATAQLVNGVRTDYEPPIKIADPLLAVGATWKYQGKVTVSGTSMKLKTSFGVKADYRVSAIGSQRIKGNTLPTLQVAGELTFFDVDGAAVFGGEESFQFIRSVGPGRIAQSGGFGELAIVLQDYALVKK